MVDCKSRKKNCREIVILAEVNIKLYYTGSAGVCAFSLAICCELAIEAKKTVACMEDQNKWRKQWGYYQSGWSQRSSKGSINDSHEGSDKTQWNGKGQELENLRRAERCSCGCDIVKKVTSKEAKISDGEHMRGSSIIGKVQVVVTLMCSLFENTKGS